MEDFQMPDIHNLEMLLKEKIHQLQWKTEALDKLNTNLNENRKMLYEERMLLDKERRRNKELELQLKSSQEIIEFLEKDKIKYHQEKVQLQINCDIAVKECDSLLNQARDDKVKNLKFEFKIKQLEEEILKKDTLDKATRLSFDKYKDKMTKLAKNLQSNVYKLKQEQDYLRKSVNDTTKFNQRLIVMGMCAHVEHRDKIETIKELQNQLNQVSIKVSAEKLDEIEGINDLSNMQVVLDESNKSDSDEDLDKQIDAFIGELQNIDGD